MDLSIRGRNLELSEPLRAAAQEKVTRLSRFLDGVEQAEIQFYEERNPRISEREVCEVTLRAHSHLIRAKAASSDAVAALDRAVAKAEHQIEKLKGKLIGRSHPRRHGSVNSVQQQDSDEEEIEPGQVRIVKNKSFAIKPMTPEEAALQMDLLGHDFYFFTNADTERAAVVYRRNDGNIGLIDASS